ncbi:MAG: hypothetical protein WC342_03860 [Methanoregula sp.]|jgi:hypothetical protein
MEDGSEINRLLEALEFQIDEAEYHHKRKWKEIWEEIKNLNLSFKESQFPTVNDREIAWNRFQKLIGHIKTTQEAVA